MRCLGACFATKDQQDSMHSIDCCSKGREAYSSPSAAGIGEESFKIGTQIAAYAGQNLGLSTSGFSSSTSSGGSSSSSSPRSSPQIQVIVSSRRPADDDTSDGGKGGSNVILTQLHSRLTRDQTTVKQLACKDPGVVPTQQGPTVGDDDQPVTILQPSHKLLASRHARRAMRKADPDSLYSSSHITSSDHAQLLPYLLQHGRCIMSLSTFQPGLYHFVMPGIGYIAYAQMANGPDLFNIFTPVCLSDPVCHPSHYETMARAFLRRFPKAMFMQISASFALVLRSCGLLVNSVGGETQLDLATYTLSGHAKRGLRSAIASAVKQGVAVEEVMHSDVTGCAVPGGGDWSVVAAEMREVDASWVAHKGQHAARVWFLNRLPVFGPEIGVRKFIARDSYGKLLAFIFFDAVYEAGSVVGYYANVTRMRPDAHPGVLNLIMREFIDRVRSESQLAAPTKKTSMKKSQRKKLDAVAATAAAGTDTASAGSNDGPTPVASAVISPNGSSGSSSCGVRFVSLGLSPLYQMNDGRFKHSSKVRNLLDLSWRQGSGFYPFKPLAAAKAKYGGGLHDGEYADPAVTYQQVYLAHSHHNTAAVALFDLGKLLGFWSQPVDAATSHARYKIAAAASKLHKVLRNHKAQQAGAVRSRSSDGHESTLAAR